MKYVKLCIVFDMIDTVHRQLMSTCIGYDINDLRYAAVIAYIYHLFLIYHRYCPGGPDSDFEYSTQSYTGYEVSRTTDTCTVSKTSCHYCLM